MPDVKVGGLYEDCSYHPCLCLNVSDEEDTIWGVSLVDGTHPRCCTLRHCGVRTLTAAEAWWAKRKVHRERGEAAQLRAILGLEPDTRAPGDGAAADFASGALYADDVGHPCLCVSINPADGTVWGISLIDGAAPRPCSLEAARDRKLDVRAAWERKREIQKLPVLNYW